MSGTAGTADLTAAGGWNRRVTGSDLTAGAGSDLASQEESDPGATVLSISATGAAGWRIKVRHSPIAWNNRFQLWVRRTSDGNGAGGITGGNGYVEVTELDADLFSGTRDRSNVSVQYKLTGLSKNISPASYLSSVVFTIQ